MDPLDPVVVPETLVPLVLLETQDPLVLLVPPVLVSTCLPLPVWVKQKRLLIRLGT